ncbi:hypothetical protein JGF03_02750 [Salmonella enterica subsp. enterica serovar Anatum]|nr:hypothetical protein [Salmonella enterica subsp. enterica serovar Anatum]MDI4750881.1 hypothetical protein [Salmonella enterica subsp. enterica serovar Anatum]MDI5670784.1 hypothetical protein [Salmonella enterica subsp. enterica serovar Anatum]MDI8988900.1 hypothetical protein [Salmonella enterica subsp. enterica serovar Anatum]NMJ52489.1 hypothetical protein [Salmonella enterica subsp. enterica serovar Anatum]
MPLKLGKSLNRGTAASDRGTRGFLLPRDTYANFSKAFQVGEWGCFYTIFSEFGVATKGPKTNLSSGKSQQKQEVQIQKKPVYTSFFMQHFMQDKTKYVS